MNQAFHLYRLQQIDNQIDQIDARISELDRLLAGNEALLEKRQQAEESHRALEKARKALKEAEFAVHEQNLKIEQTENTLYSGRVRNPKELQDLQKDIVSLKKHLAALEELQLESMISLETWEANDTNAQSAYIQAQATFAEQSAGWLGQREQFVRNRAPALSPVPSAMRELYDRLRQRKNGVAVTSVNDGSCAVCGATIRPSEVQAARASQDLMYCSTCGRILYTG
jgi:predicted  nucleic acid-binding Zn-ribbon protein